MPLQSSQCRVAGGAPGRGAARAHPHPPVTAGRSRPLARRDRPFHSGQGTLRRRRRRRRRRAQARTHAQKIGRAHV